MAGLLCASLLACGFNSQQEESEPSATPDQARAEQSATRISNEEIRAAGGATAYDVVDKLHHRWFKDQLTGKEVTVYVDNSPIEGGAQALRDFPSNTVSALEYYDGQTAIQRWGVERAGGVIVIVRNRK
jgi:hypothetical protein